MSIASTRSLAVCGARQSTWCAEKSQHRPLGHYELSLAVDKKAYQTRERNQGLGSLNESNFCANTNGASV
jgi:hypothetical protein